MAWLRLGLALALLAAAGQASATPAKADPFADLFAPKKAAPTKAKAKAAPPRPAADPFADLFGKPARPRVRRVPAAKAHLPLVRQAQARPPVRPVKLVSWSALHRVPLRDPSEGELYLSDSAPDRHAWVDP